jgi:hypothetical protein
MLWLPDCLMCLHIYFTSGSLHWLGSSGLLAILPEIPFLCNLIRVALSCVLPRMLSCDAVPSMVTWEGKVFNEGVSGT